MLDLDPKFARHGLQFLVAGGFFAYWAIAKIRAQRLDRTMPFSKFRFLQAGKIKVSGRAQSMQTQLSPLSGRQATMYMIDIEQIVLRSWVTMKALFYCRDWYLVNEAGDKLWLNPETIHIVAKPTFRKVMYPWSKNQQVDAMAEKMGFAPKYRIGLHRFFRISEYVVHPDEWIQVIAETRPIREERQLPGFQSLVLSDGPLSPFRLFQLSRLPKEKALWLLTMAAASFFILGLIIITGVFHKASSSGQTYLVLAIMLIAVIIGSYFLAGMHRR